MYNTKNRYSIFLYFCFLFLINKCYLNQILLIFQPVLKYMHFFLNVIYVVKFKIYMHFDKKYKFNNASVSFIEKRFYNRGTNSAAFSVIQRMPVKPPFPSMPIMKKGRYISQYGEILIPLIVSLV